MTGGAAVIADLIIPNYKVVSLLTAECLTPAEVATLLGVSRKTLADWRIKRQGPPFLLKPRGMVVYPTERFISYLRARPQKHCREEIGRREARWSRAMLRQDSGQTGSEATASLPRA